MGRLALYCIKTLLLGFPTGTSVVHIKCLHSLHDSGKACVERLFPGIVEVVDDFTELPGILSGMADKYEDRLRSAARGGAKTALGLLKAHYLEADVRLVSKYMPKYYEDGDVYYTVLFL